MVYGYCRISRKSQKIERQIQNIIKVYPDCIIYQEAFTGTKLEGRKEFERLLSKVTEGDTIVFDSVSRMSRSAEEGIKLYFSLYEKGVNLEFLKETYINSKVYADAISQSISSTGNEIADLYIDATNKVIRLLATKQIEKAFEQSQKEVDDLHQRTKEGIREARRIGHISGRKKGAVIVPKKKEPMKNQIKKYSKDFDGTLSDKDVIRLISISRNTYYKYKRELFEERLV